ncbi:ankyrin repeat-containing domain protein [Pelagophyceae sp. CCMP2097]|nr:ankyrin repeat-containing domain protein [Pelagophyceae sp. CCMP2097]|mmetsp:Transcript_26587/g.89465  ORF Transcript_26587/g.89465 Transcript_26587/m.89465 type:complete len:286 (+) Transcript_26587:68-925(+)
MMRMSVVAGCLAFAEAQQCRPHETAEAGDWVTVNMTARSGGETFALAPFTLHQFEVGASPIMFLNEPGLCPGNTKAVLEELRADQLPTALQAAASGAAVEVSVEVLYVTKAADYAIFEPLAAGEYGAVISMLSDDRSGVNARDALSMTPLMVAVLRKQQFLFVTLLNALNPKVDVDATTPTGYTALHYAIGAEDAVAAKALLRKGADANAALRQKSSGGWTPLHFACRFGNVALADLLLRYGADPLAMSHAGESVFDVAQQGDVDFASRKKLADLLNKAVESRDL